MASMSLFKTQLYEETYQSNPELTTADYLNVGKYLFLFSKFSTLLSLNNWFNFDKFKMIFFIRYEQQSKGDSDLS